MNKTVLLVDDDPICIYLIKDMIKDTGSANNVFTAANGKEALHFLERNCINEQEQEKQLCPDCIFLDLNMPIMDGFEFLEVFTHQFRYLPNSPSICILTSSNSSKDVEKATHFNVVSYLVKPITEEKLVEVLQKCG